MSASARWGSVRRLVPVLTLALMPFVIVPTGAGPAIGWAVGIAVLLWSGGIHRHVHWLVFGGAWALAGIIGPSWFKGTDFHIGMAGLSVSGLILLATARTWTPKRIVVAAALISTVALGWSVTHDPGGYLDVALMHRAGSDALREGVSPWEGLAVPSGVPGAPPGSVITGDPYPPPTLLWYSLSDWVTGDPRSGGAVAWMVLIVACLLGRWADPRPIVLVLTSGALPLMLWSGWTEMLSVAVLTASIALWRREVLSAVLLGTALATKQYLVVFAPLLFSKWWRVPPLRRFAPVAVGGALAVSGFALGAGYLEAIVGVYGDFPPRTDSASLFGLASAVGLDVTVPVWLGPVLGGGWAVRAALIGHVRDLSSVLVEGAKALSLLFLFGTQAHSNYWYLVGVLLLLACATGSENHESPHLVDADHLEHPSRSGRGSE